MFKSFSNGSLSILLILLLAGVLSGAAYAKGQWGIFRTIDYVSTVDPKTIVLDATENLYPKNVTLDARVIFVADRQIPGLDQRVIFGPSIIGHLEGVTKLIEGLRDEIPSHRKTLEKYYGSKLNLKGEIWNFKNVRNTVSKLQKEGFTKGGSRIVTVNGQKYRLTRWAHRKEASRRASATATGRMVLRPQPTVDSKTHMFSANFRSAGKPTFNLSGITLDADQKSLKKLYNEFKIRFQKRVKRVWTFLNRKRKMLKESQLEIVLNAPPFKPFHFKRQTSFPWYGKRQILKVNVTATPGKANIKFVDRPLGEPAFDQ